MNTNDRPEGPTHLNPTLQERTENTYDLATTPPPVDTTSVRENQGEGWPIVWLVVVIAAIAITLFILL